MCWPDVAVLRRVHCLRDTQQQHMQLGCQHVGSCSWRSAGFWQTCQAGKEGASLESDAPEHGQAPGQEGPACLSTSSPILCEQECAASGRRRALVCSLLAALRARDVQHRPLLFCVNVPCMCGAACADMESAHSAPGEHGHGVAGHMCTWSLAHSTWTAL